MKHFTFLAAVLGISLIARAAVKTQTVEYKDGDTTLKGFLAYDDAIHNEKRPGIVVVPEWWGLNDYVKSRAEQLAGLGYIAFVADIYGNGFNTTDPKIAGEKAAEAEKNNWQRTRGKLALDQLSKNPLVDIDDLAAIGYCFGGTTVLEMARASDNLRGVVSFHGILSTDHPARLGDIRARVLVLTGGADAFVPPAQVAKFKKEMKDARVEFKVISYPGAHHAFTNPHAGDYHIKNIAYNKTADEKSWAAMKKFFADLFGPANPGATSKPAAQTEPAR